ncbi:hypothetical protein, partial [Streptomonospora salina]|uniref:hypothetical protein n=1 Tax=Streptomonospora salina TaxID=104205 RepID=UPI0035E5D9EC
APATGMAAGTKIAVLSASAVLVVGAIGTGGYLTVDALAESDTAEAAPSPSPSPSPTLGPPEEIVAGIVDALDSADSYNATRELRPSEGLRGWDEYTLATVEGAPVFHSVSIAGVPDSPEAAMDRIYRPERDRLIERSWTGSDFSGSYTAATGPMDASVASMQSRQAVLTPFESLADSMEVDGRAATGLDGTPAVRIAGTFDLATPGTPGQSGIPGLEFELWTAMDGLPLRLDYVFESDDPLAGSETTWHYSGFDGLDTRLCGTVGGVPRVDRALLVPTVGETDCGEARSAVEEYLDMPDGEKEGTGYIAEVGGGWTCGLSTTAEVRERYSESAGGCYAGDLGARERVDFIRMD